MSTKCEFRLIGKGSIGGVDVEKYKSTRTGLTIVHSQVEGPLVNGYFTLATEDFTDSGCPHTLEHLIFMGSQQFPWKGVLDQLANRNLSQGTNAWTASDHTAYTLETAGSEGFLNLLPVYLDHILYPTLTDEAFVTEVHHITSEGLNAGVVYCEMQARENNEDSRVERSLLKGLWGRDHSYASETGGIMSDLRSLNNERIKNFHKLFYRPDNLCLIVVGSLDLQQLFECVGSYESDRIVPVGPLNPLNMTRPFFGPSSQIKKLESSQIHKIVFPSADEENGSVTIGYRANPYNDFQTRQAISLLLLYLSDSAVSPLQKNFIEIEDPLCGDISTRTENQIISSFIISFENVPLKSLELINQTYDSTISNLISKGLDLNRMRALIKREKRQLLSSIENYSASIISSIAISDFLYGDLDGSHFSESFSTPELLDKFISFTNEQWIDLLKKFFVDNPRIVVLASPSIAESELLQKEESLRIANDIERFKSTLGANALEILGAKLSAAIEFNSRTPPDEFLNSFPSPDIAKVQTVPVHTTKFPLNSDSNLSVSESELEQKVRRFLRSQAEALSNNGQSTIFPFSVQIDHIPSLFISSRLLLNTETLSSELKNLLPLLCEVMFELPIKNYENNSIRSADQVVQQLAADATDYGNSQGFSGRNFKVGEFGQFVLVRLSFDKENLPLSVSWLQDIVWNSVFSVDRIKIAAKRLLSEIPRLKNEGNFVCGSALQGIAYDNQSNQFANIFLRQQVVLKKIISQLEDPAQSEIILNQFESVRSIISSKSNIRLHIALDVFKQPSLLSEIRKIFPQRLNFPSNGSSVVSGIHEGIVLARSHQVANLSNRCFVVSVPASESGYLLCSSRLPEDFNFVHADIAPLQVLLEYLTALEGPLWKRIRGKGLSYSYGINLDIDQGLITFRLFKSTSLIEAYDEVYKIVQEYSKGLTLFNEIELLGAKNSFAYSLLSGCSSIQIAAREKLLDSLKNVPSNYLSLLLESVKQVKVSDLTKVHNKYLVPIFDPERSILVSSVNPKNLEKAKAGLSQSPHQRECHIVNSLHSLLIPEHLDQSSHDDQDEVEDEDEPDIAESGDD